MQTADVNIKVNKYADNAFTFTFDENISGYVPYCQIRDKSGTLMVAMTAEIIGSYTLNLYLYEADLANIEPGNYYSDVKFKQIASPYREYIQFTMNVEIANANTQIP